jgi:hypothetical protein
MGKRDTKQTLTDVKNDQSKSQTQYGDAATINSTDVTNRTAAADASRANVAGAYNGFLENGGMSYTPQSANVQHVTAGQGSRAGFSDLAATGGYDDATKSSIMDQVGQLKEFGRTGGLDPEAINRMRGNGVYDEFSKTGGLSIQDQGNIRAKALSPISSMATSMNDELARRRAVQGGYSPGFDASSRALRRDTARGIADTSLDAELGIKNAVNQGRMWGTQGLSSAEQNLQGLRTGNMLAGMSGAGNLENSLTSNIANYKMGGLQGVLGNDRMALDAGTFNAGADNSASMFDIDQATRNELAKQQGREFGAQGAGNMFAIDNADEQSARDRGLDILNAGTQANQGYYGNRTALATQPGWGTGLINGITSGAGIAAGMFGGRKPAGNV